MMHRRQLSARVYFLLFCAGGLATFAVANEAPTNKAVSTLLNCSGGGVSDSDWRTVVAAANASSVIWGTDVYSTDSAMGSSSSSGGSNGGGRVSFTALMQVTDPIGSYAKHFIALAHAWATPRLVPLLVYGALPGGNDTHPTPDGRDPRFGKVWLLAQAMREALAVRSNSGGVEKDGEHWLLWLDSDVVVLDGATMPSSLPLGSNFAADLVEAYSRPGADSRCRRKASSTGRASNVDAADEADSNSAKEKECKAADFTGVHAIIADQRDSLLGDVNAGVMLWKVSPWSLAFLEAWWNHPLALQGAYEQLVFSALWQSNARNVQRHVALTPSDALNSYPGQWWPAAGTGRRASPVLHLMQRSDTVRTSVGQAAVARVCHGLSLAPPVGSVLKPSRQAIGKSSARAGPSTDATKEAESVDWAFLASQAALVDAAAVLLSGDSLIPPNEAARVLFDLLLMAQSKEWRTAAENLDPRAAGGVAEKFAAMEIGVDGSSALMSSSSKAEHCSKSSHLAVSLSFAQTCLSTQDAAAWLTPRALAWFAAHRHLPSRKDNSNAVNANGSNGTSDGSINDSSSSSESSKANSVVVASNSNPNNDGTKQRVNGEIVRYEAIFLELVASSASGKGSTTGEEEKLLRRASSLRELHLPALHRVSDPPAAQSEFAASLGRLAQVIAASSSASPSTAPTAVGARQIEAEDMLRKATRLRLAALASLGLHGGGRSSRHPDSASLQLDLASLLEGQGGRSMLEGGRLEEALALTRVAANDLEHSLGEHHPWVAASVHRVASLLLQMGRRDDAESVHRRALRIRQSLAESVHSCDQWWVDCRNNVTGKSTATSEEVKQAAKEPNKETVEVTAEAVAAALSEGLAQSSTSESEDVAASLNALAELLREKHSGQTASSSSSSDWTSAQKDLQEAKHMNQRALAIYKRLHGPVHYNVALVENNLGLTLSALGDVSGAVEALHAAADTWASLQGPSHPQVAMSLNNAAAVQWQAGRLEAAIKDTQRALRILEAAYGRDNSFVAMLNMALGKLKNGEPYPIAT